MSQPYKIFDAAAMSGTATIYSELISADNLQGLSSHFEWTGAPTGAFTMWASDKVTPNQASDADWVEVTGWSPTDPAGAAGKFRTDDNTTRAKWRRIKYVNAFGTGTLNAWVTYTTR